MVHKDRQTPILDLRKLETPEDRPKLLLDSGEYPILTGDDLGPINAQRLNRLADEYSSMSPEESDEVTDEQVFTNLRSQIAIICPDIPADDLASMSYHDMLDIVLFFRHTGGMSDYAARVMEVLDKYRSPSNGTS